MVAVGAYSQTAITSGDGNASLGAYSLFSATSAAYNTAIGINSAYSLTTGGYNITIGAYVDPPSVTGSRQLNIGNVLFGTSMYNGGTQSSAPIAGKIGIGGVPSTHELEVNGAIKSNTPIASTADGTVATTAFAGAAWTAFTPTLGAGAGTLTAASATGRYKQVGKLYLYNIQILITTNGTAATYLTYTLPNSSTPIALGSAASVNAGVGNFIGSARHVNGSNTALLFKYDGTYPGANGSAIYVSGYYEAA
jgi:hypothetical protein